MTILRLSLPLPVVPCQMSKRRKQNQSSTVPLLTSSLFLHNCCCDFVTMSGRKRPAEDDPIIEERDDREYEEGQQLEENLPFGKRFKHTLDSDEEDDQEESEKYNILSHNEIEGEEEGVARREQDIQITPFNMKEELEEGHVDKEGMYIFNKEKDEVKDHWLDNIDWVQIKDSEVKRAMKREEEEENEVEIDITACYETILKLLQPGETVQRAIRRLGQKSKGKDQNPGDKKAMMDLITVADQVLNSGDMDIYERTYDQLTTKLKEGLKETTETDMFAEDDNEVSKTKVSAFNSETVMWEFKWEDKEDAEIHGPFSNEQMMKWQNEGYFEKGVFVRQVNKPNSSFNSSKRIDFDLYS